MCVLVVKISSVNYFFAEYKYLCHFPAVPSTDNDNDNRYLEGDVGEAELELTVPGLGVLERHTRDHDLGLAQAVSDVLKQATLKQICTQTSRS